MSEEKNNNQENKSEEPIIEKPENIVIESNQAEAAKEQKKAPVEANKRFFGAGGGDRKKMKKGRSGGRDKFEKKDEFEQRVLDVARVTRVMAGGKRMNFRTCVAIGDKKGKIGVGLGKGADVTMAVNKAVNKAQKSMVEVPIVNETIPHEVYCKLGAAKILFKPAKKGKGVIAGGVVRVILELAGVHNVSSKILGTNNKINNARCAVEAFKRLKKTEIKKKEEKPGEEKKEQKVEEKN
ncbi:MAG: 30S ribosomal protein S5 [Patescibacteria group bacterium]|jgi:small subunit ribosomal protein S5